MRLRPRFLTVAVAVVVALATMSGVAQAVVPPEDEPLIAAALARIGDGTYTTADLDLIRRYPEIAETVPDPTQEKMVVPIEGTGAEMVPDPSEELTRCWYADVRFRKRSVTGLSILYDWHHYVEWCASGTRVTKFRIRYDYATNVSAVTYIRELVTNKASPLPASSGWSHLARHMELCVFRYGCYWNGQPWSKITVRYNGRYSYVGENA